MISGNGGAKNTQTKILASSSIKNNYNSRYKVHPTSFLLITLFLRKL